MVLVSSYSTLLHTKLRIYYCISIASCSAVRRFLYQQGSPYQAVRLTISGTIDYHLDNIVRLYIDSTSTSAVGMLPVERNLLPVSFINKENLAPIDGFSYFLLGWCQKF